MRILLFILLLGCYSLVKSQDPHFSQFYANLLYLSPSFTGNTQGSRIIADVRDQWPGIPGAFVTSTFSVDHFIPNLNSGIGILFLKDVAGQGRLGTNQLGIQYSYQFRVNNNYYLRPGIHFYHANRTIDFNRLVFNDQLDLSGVTGGSVEIPPLKKVGYIDFASSLLIYNKQSWIGFTLDHLVSPNQSIVDGYSPIPKKYSIFGGYKFYLNGKTSTYNEESLNTWIYYYWQGKFDQLTIGTYWTRTPLILGLWFRGIPFLKSYKPRYLNNDAFIIQAGYIYKDIKLAYSFDLTISRLITNTFGSHEITIVYEFNQNQKFNKKTKKEIIPCPKY